MTTKGRVRRPHASGPNDAGSATVLAACLICLLVVVAGVAGLISGLVATHARAQSAADLAALAGADRALWSAQEACAAASAIAQRNGARIIDCGVDALDVVVTVEVPLPGAVARVMSVAGGTPDALRAHSRAGPPGA